MDCPPLLLGAVHDKATWLFTVLEPLTLVGASGTSQVVTLDEFEEYDPVPTEFTAATLKMYDVPCDNPVTV